MKRKMLCAVSLISLLCLIAPHALAHATLDHAEPRVGATVTRSPAEVKVWFSQKVEAAFSKIEVFDAAGKQVDRKDSRVDPKDKALLVVSVPDLAPGTYKVVWHAVSVDTHRTHGDFKFHVKP
jgi:hypothetical protein